MFQMSEPAIVSSRKMLWLIRSMPAGIEMRERKMGIIRPKNTALRPWRPNQATVRSTSSGLTSGSFAAHPVIRSWPKARPTQ